MKKICFKNLFRETVIFLNQPLEHHTRYLNEKTFSNDFCKEFINHKCFVRPNFDYADIIYDNPLNESFNKKIEMVQFSAAHIITGTIKEAYRDKIYQGLGLESLSDRR